MFDTLSQTTAIIFAATSRAVLASPRPPLPVLEAAFGASVSRNSSNMKEREGRIWWCLSL